MRRRWETPVTFMMIVGKSRAPWGRERKVQISVLKLCEAYIWNMKVWKELLFGIIVK